MALLTDALGDPLGTIAKKEIVYFLNDEVVVSLMEIGKELYMEIEGHELLRNYSYFQSIKKVLQLDVEPRSLFEIYIETKVPS